ncbi:MAG: hypothetical protein ACKO0Z_20250 [Betaproteobacteria bacterium]
MTRDEDDGFTDFVGDEVTLAAYQESELKRGVPLEKVLVRLKRLISEASQWRD